MRPAPLLLLPLAACQIYDDISVTVAIPASVQAEFATAYPDRWLRPVITYDGAPASLAVLCEPGAEDVELYAKFLQAGCYQDHTFEVFLTALDPASGVPCGVDFQLDQGGRELDQYLPAASLTLSATDNGRCGPEGKDLRIDVEGLPEG